MIVLDASAALELLLNTPRASDVAARVFADERSMHAPQLIDLEVAQVLRRLLRRGEIDLSRADQALRDLADLALSRYPHEPLLPAIWALRDDATAYDAAYLALADVLDAPLLTCDAALAAMPGVGVRVELV